MIKFSENKFNSRITCVVSYLICIISGAMMVIISVSPNSDGCSVAVVVAIRRHQSSRSSWWSTASSATSMHSWYCGRLYYYHSIIFPFLLTERSENSESENSSERSCMCANAYVVHNGTWLDLNKHNSSGRTICKLQSCRMIFSFDFLSGFSFSHFIVEWALTQRSMHVESFSIFAYFLWFWLVLVNRNERW